MNKLLIVLLALSSSLFASDKGNVLFVGFDAGETNIWVQVLKDWKDAPASQILTMATATKVAKEAELDHITTVESLGISCPANQRLYELSKEDLEKVSALSASVLMTGMYSTPERQIAELFAKKGSKIVAVWDNFSTYDKLPPDLVANVERIVQVASVILVPSAEIAQDLNQRFDCNKALALGQPTLDLWEEKIAQVDRQAVFSKIAFSDSLPVITYISGYEEKGNRYQDSFTLFANSLTALDQPVQLVVQLHPRSDGSFERDLLKTLHDQNPHFPHFFISDGKTVSTFEAVALADLVVCHRSTVSVQALFAGKRCLHVDVPGTPFSHFAIQAGLVPQCLSQEDATHMIAKFLHLPQDVEALYEQSGILPHSTQQYRNHLKTWFEEINREKPQPTESRS